MKRLMSLALLVLSLVMTAAPASASMIDDVVKRGTLRVGFSSFVPWAMQDKEGNYVGFEIDVAARLAKDLGVKLQPVPTSWDGIIPALLAGKFDVIIGGMGITPQRTLSVNFTIPYDHSYIDLTMNREKAGNITSMEALNNPDVIIAVRTGTTAAAAAQAIAPKATFRMFNDEAPAVEEVLSGRAHVFVSSAPLPAMETLKRPDKLVQTVSITGFRSPIAFAVKKGDFDSLNVLDAWIRLVEEEGWLEGRRQYWFKSNAWEALLK